MQSGKEEYALMAMFDGARNTQRSLVKTRPADIKTLERKVKKLKSDNAAQAAQVDRYKSKVNKLKKELTVLQAKLASALD